MSSSGNGWNQFRALDLDALKSLMKSPVLVDLRNVYRAAEVEAHGFTYSASERARNHDKAVGEESPSPAFSHIVARWNFAPTPMMG